MSRISDLIEKFINELIEQGEGAIEIQRNEMASHFDCAPSQINYVLMTRFTTERGYIIESRRGGGGSIKISRVTIEKEAYLLNMLANKIGSSINKESAFELAEALYKQQLIDRQQMKLMKAALDDTTLSLLQRPFRDRVRAELLKALILAAVTD